MPNVKEIIDILEADEIQSYSYDQLIDLLLYKNDQKIGKFHCVT